MADQTVFEHCVKGVLHSAIPISLDRSLNLEMGSLLVYEKTPTRWKPWRKHNLVFTGFTINEILKTPVPMKTDQSSMYDSATYNRTIDDKVDLDGDVKTSLIDFGMNFNVGEKRVLGANFGKVDRIRWNLREEVIHGDFKGVVNTDHLITNDAAKHGATVFVVTHLYQASQVKITLNSAFTIGGGIKPSNEDPPPSGTDDDTTGAQKPAATEGEGDAKDTGGMSTVAGVTRSTPTNVAFRLLAFTFDANGTLAMKLRSDLSHLKIKYLEEVDGRGEEGEGQPLAGHIREDEACPHTLGTQEVATYCQTEGAKK